MWWFHTHIFKQLPHRLVNTCIRSHNCLFFFFNISGKHLLHLYIIPVWTHYLCCEKLRISAVSACVCAQSCLTLGHTMSCSPPASSVRGIFQARRLEWVSIPFSRDSSRLRDLIHIFSVSCAGRQILYHWAAREALSQGITTIFFFFRTESVKDLLS